MVRVYRPQSVLHESPIHHMTGSSQQRRKSLDGLVLFFSISALSDDHCGTSLVEPGLPLLPSGNALVRLGTKSPGEGGLNPDKQLLPNRPIEYGG